MLVMLQSGGWLARLLLVDRAISGQVSFAWGGGAGGGLVGFYLACGHHHGWAGLDNLVIQLIIQLGLTSRLGWVPLVISG